MGMIVARSGHFVLRPPKGPSLILLLGGLISCGEPMGGMGPASQLRVDVVEIQPGEASLEVGAGIQLTAVARAASGAELGGQPVTWTSSNPSVASVATSGFVTGVAEGVVAVTATAQAKSGSATITVTPEAVANVSLDRPLFSVPEGGVVQLSATLYGASGSTLERTVAWISSDPAVATVSQSGVVTGVALGGPITVSATSEGQSANAQVTVAAAIATGITNIERFLETCPTNDPALGQIVADFELLEDGQSRSIDLACTEPFSTQPIEQLSDELIAYQVLRAVYYMSVGSEGSLPWTAASLFEWMSSRVAGFNFKSSPGQLYCCDLIGGKRYVSVSRQDDATRETKRTWPGLASTLAFYAHEMRHADPGAPFHVNGCAAFPLTTDPLGCDESYDPLNLGSYGVQFWLHSQWTSGFLNIGIACEPSSAMSHAQYHASSANNFRSRFVTNLQPVVVAVAPYGGECIGPGS